MVDLIIKQFVYQVFVKNCHVCSAEGSSQINLTIIFCKKHQKNLGFF